MDPLSAIAEPRLHDEDIPQTTTRTTGQSRIWHRWDMISRNWPPGLSIAQGVMEKGQVFQTATDPRRIDSAGVL
jgi:gamma-glutamyltranspeptidase